MLENPRARVPGELSDRPAAACAQDRQSLFRNWGEEPTLTGSAVH